MFGRSRKPPPPPPPLPLSSQRSMRSEWQEGDGHILNPDVLSVSSSITGSLPAYNPRHNSQQQMLSSNSKNNDDGDPPEDIFVESSSTSGSPAGREPPVAADDNEEDAGVVFKGWGGGGVAPSPAMTNITHKRSTTTTSTGWFGTRRTSTVPDMEHESPAAPLNNAAEEALKELQEIGGIQIKCLDQSNGGMPSAHTLSLEDDDDVGGEANNKNEDEKVAGETTSGNAELIVSDSDPTPYQSDDLDANAEAESKQDSDSKKISTGGGWWGGGGRTSKKTTTTITVEAPATESASRPPPATDPLDRTAPMGIDEGDAPLSQAELLKQKVEAKKKQKKASTGWFGGGSNKTTPEDDTLQEMEDLLNAEQEQNGAQKMTHNANATSGTETRKTSWFGGGSSSRRVDDSPVVNMEVRSVELNVEGIENVVSNLDKSPEHLKTMHYGEKRLSNVPPALPDISTSRGGETTTTRNGGYLTSSSSEQTKATSRFDIATKPVVASSSTTRRGDALRERMANRQTNVAAQAKIIPVTSRRASTGGANMTRDNSSAAPNTNHGVSNTGFPSRRMSTGARSNNVSFSSDLLNQGNNNEDDEDELVEDVTSRGGATSSFLNGWGFMKNLGREQVAETKGQKKYKRSAFVVSAVDWKEPPKRKNSKIAAVKKASLISDDVKCQQRFQWGQEVLRETFVPYREMLCGSDDLLPDTDEFNAFIDTAEDDQSREAYIQTMMLQHGELSEREVVAFFEGLSLFKVKNRALVSQLESVGAARRFDLEHKHSTLMQDRRWESSVAEANDNALLQLRRHMPVLIRSMTEEQLSFEPSPTGKMLPKRFAKKFKQANVLQLIRMAPSDIIQLHPATIENLRLTGLTLFERRALHAHLKSVGPRWKELFSKEKDPLSERKYNWFIKLKQTFKERLSEYDQHIAEYGPPGNHPYATRANPKGGCPLIGKQCPLKAEKMMDYSFDYGYPEEAIFHPVMDHSMDKSTSAETRSSEKQEALREKRASERSEMLLKHYNGKLLQTSMAVCACQEMDDAIDRLAKREARWVKNHVIWEYYDVEGEDWKEIQAFHEALKDIREITCKMFARSGLVLTYDEQVNARESLDRRGLVEIGLSEDVRDAAEDFLKGVKVRLKSLTEGSDDIKREIREIQELLQELKARNTGSLRAHGARRPKPSVLLKSREDLEKMVRKRMKAALQSGMEDSNNTTLTMSSSDLKQYQNSATPESSSALIPSRRLSMLAEFATRMEDESVASGVPVKEIAASTSPAPNHDSPKQSKRAESSATVKSNIDSISGVSPLTQPTTKSSVTTATTEQAKEDLKARIQKNPLYNKPPSTETAPSVSVSSKPRTTTSNGDALRARMADLAAKRSDSPSIAAGTVSSKVTSASRRESIADIQARIAKRREARAAATAK